MDICCLGFPLGCHSHYQGVSKQAEDESSSTTLYWVSYYTVCTSSFFTVSFYYIYTAITTSWTHVLCLPVHICQNICHSWTSIINAALFTGFTAEICYLLQDKLGNHDSAATMWRCGDSRGSRHHCHRSCSGKNTSETKSSKICKKKKQQQKPIIVLFYI